jgi:hypothetical protein
MSLLTRLDSKLTEHQQIQVLKNNGRESFLKEKTFIFEISKASSFRMKELLMTANESQITTLIFLLFFISKKEIPITERAVEKLKKSKMFRKLQNLFPNTEYLKLCLSTNRETQIKLIKPFLNVLPMFVTALIVLPKK